MGRHKKSTKSRIINLSKTPSHKCHGVAEDWAPREAMNHEKVLETLEKDVCDVDYQSGWNESDKEEVWCTSRDSSSIVCPDRGDEEEIHPCQSSHFNMVLFKGIENWQKLVDEKLASTKRPRHYLRTSSTTLWRARKDARKNGQTIENFFGPSVGPGISGEFRQS